MILVTGGTGSLGRAYVARHHGEPIRVLSRDEEKQRAMALDFPDVDYRIGDVRDRDAVRHAMVGIDRVVHAAALKQVPPLEAAPIEAVKTNILGTENVCAEAWEQGAKLVTISTDKAVEPIGVMGATKMLAEAVTTSYNFAVVRYGNVIGSRGSIIPVWRAAMRKGQPIRVTDPSMTRFLITLDEALDLIDLALSEPMSGAVYVRKSPVASVGQLARVIGDGHPTLVTGIRPGEKHDEALVVEDEAAETWDGHFVIHRGGRPAGVRYGSQTARCVSDDELAELLKAAPDAL